VNPNDEPSTVFHVPVLVEDLAERICLPKEGIMVDTTVGHGGHSSLLGSSLGPAGTLVGLDVDPRCLEIARGRLADLACRVVLVRENFSRLDSVLDELSIDQVDGILADLGFCSGQLEDPQRGLSLQTPMPLDMRLDDRLERTAADLVNTADTETLADILWRYGEERRSRRIARFITEQRTSRPIRTTTELASLVCRAVRGPRASRWQRLHPATRTFQALRIAVNDELGCLERLLQIAPHRLRGGGWMAVISFHSLEDRIVKHDFKRNRAAGLYEVLTDKPITCSAEEVARNPRARSAKLRMARRTSR